MLATLAAVPSNAVALLLFIHWLCFFSTKMANAAASPAPPTYADHKTGGG